MGALNFTLTYNNKQIFSAEKTENEIEFHWKFSSHKKILDLINELGSFETILRYGNFQKSTKNYYFLIKKLKSTIKKDNLPDSSFIKDFYFFEYITPYVFVKVYNNSGKIWTPKNGMIEVFTKQDISKPLSKFILNTGNKFFSEENLENKVSYVINDFK